MFSTVSRLFLPAPDDWSLIEGCIRLGRVCKQSTVLPVKSLIPPPANIERECETKVFFSFFFTVTYRLCNQHFFMNSHLHLQLADPPNRERL